MTTQVQKEWLVCGLRCGVEIWHSPDPYSAIKVASLNLIHGDTYRAYVTDRPWAAAKPMVLGKDLQAVPPGDDRLKAGWGNQYILEMLLLMICGEVQPLAFYRWLAEGFGGEIQKGAARILGLVRGQEAALSVQAVLDSQKVGVDADDFREAVAAGEIGDRQRMDELVQRLLELGENPETGCDWRPTEMIEEDQYAL